MTAREKDHAKMTKIKNAIGALQDIKHSQQTKDQFLIALNVIIQCNNSVT